MQKLSCPKFIAWAHHTKIWNGIGLQDEGQTTCSTMQQFIKGPFHDPQIHLPYSTPKAVQIFTSVEAFMYKILCFLQIYLFSESCQFIMSA